MQPVNSGPMLEIQVFPEVQALNREAAQRLVKLAKAKIAATGRFSLALSGGSTPQKLYSLLATYKEQIEWSKVFIFFGDERCVPPDHPESNYRMANEALLSKVPISPENSYRMHGEDPPEEAAEAYAKELERFFGLEHGNGPSPENFPSFDLILLGMGADGQTASLFPATSALHEHGRPVTANFVPQLKTERLTLTAPTINRAAQIWFLVVGEDKASTLARVLEGEYQPQTYPSQLIRPQQGKLIWMLDEAAAAKLTKKT
ncbi:MAG: 6-phosphogluconolactonase [Chloroflexota bacterium]